MFKKFSRYLLIGASALVLLVAAQQGLFSNKNIQLAQALDCNPGEPVTDCHTLTGTGHKYCVWNADGNTESDCVVETCFNGGNPPNCGGSSSDTQATDQTFPCMTNSSLCGENTQFCENTSGRGSATMFKHAGVCNPAEGSHDANGCVFLFDNVRSFTGLNCQDVTTVSTPVAPTLTCGGPNPDRTNPEPNCNKAGAPQGLCCTICGNGKDHCDRFNGENEVNCPADCTPAPAPRQQVQQQATQQQQQQINECPRSDYENGHPQRCVNGRFVQCFCDSQGCTWQHDNGACGGTTTTTTPVPPAPPAPPACRSINCPTAPSGCAFTGQLISTCNPAVTLTCGTLTCNQIPPAVGGITNNNTNSNTNNNTNTVTVNNPTPQVVLASVPTTLANVGVGTSVISPAALPKTGLPALVWTALAFIPAGLKMRSFSQVRKALENKAGFIWEERQFRNGS